MGYQNSGWARVICGAYPHAECGRIRSGREFYTALFWRGFAFWKSAELVAQAETCATNFGCRKIERTFKADWIPNSSASSSLAIQE